EHGVLLRRALGLAPQRRESGLDAQPLTESQLVRGYHAAQLEELEVAELVPGELARHELDPGVIGDRGRAHHDHRDPTSGLDERLPVVPDERRTAQPTAGPHTGDENDRPGDDEFGRVGVVVMGGAGVELLGEPGGVPSGAGVIVVQHHRSLDPALRLVSHQASPRRSPATTRAERPSNSTTSPSTSPRPRRASTSPLTLTAPEATASLASAPESISDANLRNWPSVSLVPRSHSTSSTGGRAGGVV